MAAPTDPRAESTSLTSNTIRWVYPGAHVIGVYRSTDGISYSLIATVAAATLLYEDTGLSTGTKYWYKLSDDDGSTFSSVVTVFTQTCPSADGASDTLGLPRFDGSEQQSDSLNEFAEKVEAMLKANPDSGVKPECKLCITDGALVIECGEDCTEYVVIMDQDINSISVNNCQDTGFNINFVIPQDTTRKICGWPVGMGFSGDECFQAPIAGGATGRVVGVGTIDGEADKDTGKSKPGPGGGGGGTGKGTCFCIPGKQNQLAIKVCATNNSVGCGTASVDGPQVLACGGKPPYTWTASGTVTLTRATGNFTRVNKPSAGVYSGSGSDIAYRYCFKISDTGFGGDSALIASKFSCSDSHLGCEQSPSPACATTPCCEGPGDTGCAGGVAFGCKCWPDGSIETSCTVCGNNAGAYEDLRTALMITNGCTPCGSKVAGQTVTVTDATGTSVSATLSA